jgi:hypothetical protein
MYTSIVNYSYYVFLLSFEREGDQDYKGMHVVVQLELVVCKASLPLISVCFSNASSSIYPGLLTLYQYY